VRVLVRASYLVAADAAQRRPVESVFSD
jgi:hypothetical protein